MPPLHRTLSLKWIWPAVSETLVLNETKPTKRSQITDQNLRKEANACQTRFEFLSQFRKVRNAFEWFVTQVQTQLPKTKRVWPMKINVICTVGPNSSSASWLLYLGSLTLVINHVAANSYIAPFPLIVHRRWRGYRVIPYHVARVRIQQQTLWPTLSTLYLDYGDL